METSQVNRLMIELTRLSTTADEVIGLLTAQQNVLKMRGMQLPANVLEQVTEIREQVNAISAQMESQQPELAQLRALVRSMSMINSTLDLEQVLNEVMDTFIELTEAERGLIVLRDPVTHALDFKVVRGLDQRSMQAGAFMISRTIVEDVARTGKPVLTTNALEDQRYSAQESIISYAVRSIICVPLKVKDEVIGVAYADHRYRKELFGEHELKFLAGFGNQAAIAIENARLYDNIQQRLAQISEIRNFLNNIFTSIVSGVITLDDYGEVVTINRSAAHILGLPTDRDYTGRSYRDIFPAFFEGFDEMLNAVRTEGRQQIVEINSVLANRGPVTLNLKISPLRDADSQQRIRGGITIVIDDLTELKQRDATLSVVNTYLSAEMVANIQSIDSLGLGGEDRMITAVFADVRGFTTFSERLTPETLMRVINQYLSVSSDAIQLTQGIIDKFMGDAVLGLYNTQLNPQDNHAERCVRSALMMVRDVEALHEVLPEDQRLFYGIGIHTGPATLGNVGSPSRKEFTAIGEAVVYAKKFQETAQGGEIIISPETYEYVKDFFICEPVQRQLRGENIFLDLYRVIDVR